MSLVNDMLNDLEQRRAGQPERKENLDWLTAQAPSNKNRKGVVFKILLLILMVVAIAVVLERWYLTPQAINKVATVLPSVPVTKEQARPIHVPVLPALQSLSFEQQGDEARILLAFNAKPEYQLSHSDNTLRLIFKEVGKTLPVIKNALVPPFADLAFKAVGDELQLVLQLATDVEITEQLQQNDLLLAVSAKPVKKVVAKSVATKSKSLAAKTKLATPKLESKATSVKPAPQIVKQNKPLTLAQKDQRLAQQAAALVQRGELVAAEKMLADFVVNNPGAVDATALLVELKLGQQQLSQAQTLLNTVRSHLADNAELRRLQAYLFVLQNQADEAVQLLLSSKPPLKTETAYYELLASAAQRAKQYALSIQVYKSLLRVDASQGQWWLGLAISQELYGLKADARQNFLQVIKVGRISDSLRDYAQSRYNALAGAVNIYPQAVNGETHGG